MQNMFGVITATYFPANYLSIKRGDEISVLPCTPVGTFGSNKLVAYLGTIEIRKEPNDHYFNPQMVGYNCSNEVKVSGMTTGGEVVETGFHIYAHTSMPGNPFRLGLHRPNMPPPLYDEDKDKDKEITANPFIVNLFLVSKQTTPPSYIEGEALTIESGELGSFNIKVSTSLTPKVEEFISINGQTIPPGGGAPSDPPIELPLIGSGTPIPEIIFGDDDPPPVTFQVDVLEESPFNLMQACDYTGVRVATMDVRVVNGVQGEDYAIQVKFTNPQNSTSFSLRPQGKPNGYAIPYKLRFGDEYNIKGGDLYDWDDLVVNGFNSKDIKVYDINKTIADNAPAGIFEDTITVEIFSVN